MKEKGGEGIACLRTRIRTGDLSNTKHDDETFIADVHFVAYFLTCLPLKIIEMYNNIIVLKSICHGVDL
jgi:hypothetical protein